MNVLDAVVIGVRNSKCEEECSGEQRRKKFRLARKNLGAFQRLASTRPLPKVTISNPINDFQEDSAMEDQSITGTKRGAEFGDFEIESKRRKLGDDLEQDMMFGDPDRDPDDILMDEAPVTGVKRGREGDYDMNNRDLKLIRTSDIGRQGIKRKFEGGLYPESFTISERFFNRDTILEEYNRMKSPETREQIVN